ncbi:MAG: nickel pincer cofactor biosynthesis protein LarC [Kiritimatiellaeota bacterium]|nr:nickel pincer cofactor biosynthesis protein LarC [Kiritimatiellota bacterium]
MKTLLIEPFGGVAGDMIVASLLGLGVDFDKFKEALETLPVSQDWSVELTDVERHAISAKHFSVAVGEEKHHQHSDSKHHSHHHDHPRNHDQDHHNDHEKTDSAHSRHHRNLDQVLEIINGAPRISDTVKERATAVFAKLARAEAEVHGKDDPRGVHFHEVGAVDAIIDITGACLALEVLGIEHIVSYPIPLGTGSVKSAHGVLPVPVPATVNILRGIPVERTDIPFELATPTGAAILAELVDEWLPASPSPCESAIPAGSKMLKSAYGAGARDIPQRAGVVRATLFERFETGCEREMDEVAVLECEIDDMPGEVFSWLSPKLLEAGALDFSVTANMMKKNRSGFSLRVICAPTAAAETANLILRETTTLGVRHNIVRRFKLRRENREVETPLGTVSAKFAFAEDGTLLKAKPEYESVAKLAEANGTTYLEALKTVEKNLPGNEKKRRT